MQIYNYLIKEYLYNDSEENRLTFTLQTQALCVIKKIKVNKTIKNSILIFCIGFFINLTSWNLNKFEQTYQFQEPSLRTKIFDIQSNVYEVSNDISYQIISKGIKRIKFQGELVNECILITYPQKISQSMPVKIIYNTLKKDKRLSKNIVLLSYNNIQNLKNFFQNYYFNQNQNSKQNFGVIRAALNIDIQHKKEVNKKNSDLKAIFKIYGKYGIHVDVDFFQSIKQLLERLRIQWSPCKQIHSSYIVKLFFKKLMEFERILTGCKSKISHFIDNYCCQAYQSILKQTNQSINSHQTLMQYGFQASSLKFIQSTLSYENNQKIAQLLYSFLKQFSFQQDHLHSSSTYFYPISQTHYIGLNGIITGGVIIFLIGLINIIGRLYEQNQIIKSNVNMYNVGQIMVLVILYNMGYIDYLYISLIYLCIKSICKLGVNIFLKHKKQQKQIIISLQGMILITAQLFITFYLSIFNFSLFHISALLSFMMLFVEKRIFIILMIIISLIISVFLLTNNGNLDTIKQINLSYLELNRFLQNSIHILNKLSNQFIIVIFPFMYWLSTFQTK